MVPSARLYSLLLFVLLSANSATAQDVIATEITPETQEYCTTNAIGERSRCACYHGYFSKKRAVDAEALCKDTYTPQLDTLQSNFTEWSVAGKVAEQLLDEMLLKTVRVCGGSETILDSARMARPIAFRLSPPGRMVAFRRPCQLTTTERFFFLGSVFAIIVKQTVLAVVRRAATAIARSLPNAIGRRTVLRRAIADIKKASRPIRRIRFIARRKAAAAKNAAQALRKKAVDAIKSARRKLVKEAKELQKRAVKEAREAVHDAAECMGKELLSAEALKGLTSRQGSMSC